MEIKFNELVGVESVNGYIKFTDGSEILDCHEQD